VTNTPTLGATKTGRKSTSVVLVLKFSANAKFTTYHLDITYIDFNLGTPRSEISSHLHSITHPVITQIQLE